MTSFSCVLHSYVEMCVIKFKVGISDRINLWVSIKQSGPQWGGGWLDILDFTTPTLQHSLLYFTLHYTTTHILYHELFVCQSLWKGVKLWFFALTLHLYKSLWPVALLGYVERGMRVPAEDGYKMSRSQHHKGQESQCDILIAAGGQKCH